MSVFDLIAGTLDGVFAVDRNQRIAFWNDAACQILGFESEEVLGRPCYKVLGGADSVGCPVCGKRCATFRASLRGELSPTSDVLVNRKGGGRVWVSVTTVVLPSRWHELSLLAHVFRDTSAVKQVEARLEQALAEAETQTRSVTQPCTVETLTQRETEILRLLAAGASTAAITSRFGIGTATVRTHIQHILSKLGVHSRLEAVASASRNGWLGRSGRTPST